LGSLKVVWAGTALAAAAVAAAALVLAGGDSTGPTTAAALSVHASFEPDPVEFGDPVTAHVVAVADRRAVESGRIRLSAALRPLSAVGKPHVTRTERGGLLVIAYDVRAVCAVPACLAAHGPRVLRLRPVRVTAPLRAGGLVAARSGWPPLEVRGRVARADVTPRLPPFRADVRPPAVSYRVDPSSLALGLRLAAALLAAVGVLLAGRQVAALLRHRRREDERTELERALALAREARGRPPQDRRRAVGLLARLLTARDEGLAGDARELAWSKPPPTRDSVSELVARVEREAEE
jgi:hypothetical protein